MMLPVQAAVVQQRRVLPADAAVTVGVGAADHLPRQRHPGMHLVLCRRAAASSLRNRRVPTVPVDTVPGPVSPLLWPALSSTRDTRHCSKHHASVVPLYDLLTYLRLQDNWTPGSPAQNRSRFAVGDVTSSGLAALRSNRGRCPQASVLRSELGLMHNCISGAAAVLTMQAAAPWLTALQDIRSQSMV